MAPLWLGLAVIVIAGVVIGVIAGNAPRHGNQTASPGSPNASGLLNVSSSQILAQNSSFLTASGKVFVLGNDGTLTLLNASGSVAWHENASVNDLVSEYDGDPTPQTSRRCAIATDNGGTDHTDAEFITLSTGAQHATSGYGIMFGNRVAWTDGTIRDACTGAILGRADPNNPADSVGTPECLVGSIMIENGGMASELEAWQDGHELWQKSDNYDALCDSDGTTILIDGIDHTITRINADTGRVYWTVNDPTCPGSGDGSCISEKGFPGVVTNVGNVILVSGADDVLAFSKSTGHLLWEKLSACMLAARSLPRAEVLVGPCNGTYDNNNGVTQAVGAATGTATKTWDVGNYDQWSANVDQMLAVDSNTGAARVVDW